MTIHCYAHMNGSCGRFNIPVNRDYLHAQNQGKLASFCLQQLSSIFETTYNYCILFYTFYTEKSFRLAHRSQRKKYFCTPFHFLGVVV